MCPHCHQPQGLCGCGSRDVMNIAEELFVDAASSPKEAFIGGLEDVSLTLEYMKSGTSPEVKLTITNGGETTAWDVTGITDGYTIKDDFASIAPGSQIKLEVTDCTARLRWCETIHC